MSEPAPSDTQEVAASEKRVGGWRGRVAMVLMLVLMIWPYWSMNGLWHWLNSLPGAMETQQVWAARELRFKAFSQSLPPGTVVAYHTNWPLPPGGSRLHEAQFAGAPVIVTDIWYDKTTLVLVDVLTDKLLDDAIAEQGYELIERYGEGFALVRRKPLPADVSQPPVVPDPADPVVVEDSP